MRDFLLGIITMYVLLDIVGISFGKETLHRFLVPWSWIIERLNQLKHTK